MKYSRILFFLCLALLASFSFAHRAGADDLKKYYYVSPDKLLEYIASKPGRRVVLFYASWCGYCRLEMPDIIALEKEKKGSVIAISVDEKPDNLVRYLNSIGGAPFPAFVLNNEKRDLRRKMASIGIKLQPGIPFSALLDEKNNVFDQGALNARYIASYIKGR